MYAKFEKTMHSSIDISSLVSNKLCELTTEFLINLVLKFV